MSQQLLEVPKETPAPCGTHPAQNCFLGAGGAHLLLPTAPVSRRGAADTVSRRFDAVTPPARLSTAHFCWLKMEKRLVSGPAWQTLQITVEKPFCEVY